MGYYVNTREVHFHIRKANQEDALKAIKDAAKEQIAHNKHWSWQDPKEILNCKAFDDYMAYTGWDPSFLSAEDAKRMNKYGKTDIYSEGDLIDLSYSDKLGSENGWLDTLAPFVEPGSYIELGGEEGIFRYTFDGHGVEEQSAMVVWEDWEGMLKTILEADPKAAAKYLGLRPDLDKVIAKHVKERKNA